MEYNKGVGGDWVKADDIVDGSKVRIVNEVTKQDSKFKDPKSGELKTENVGKVRFQGAEAALNFRFNWTTIYGLIDAFGKDSKAWIGQTLTARTKEALVGDTVRTVVYLVPEGFELAKNEEKKLEIRKIGNVEPTSYPADDIDPADIPF